MSGRVSSSTSELISRLRISLRCLSTILCALGCLCHFTMINVKYFKYETVAAHAPWIALYQNVPMISLCFVPFTSTDKNETFMKQSKPIVPKYSQLIQTVDASTVVRDCYLRNFTTKLMDHSDDCSKLFAATLSTRKNFYICYTLDIYEQPHFSPLELAAAPIDKFILYRMRLKDEFLNFNRIALFTHLFAWPKDAFLYLIDIDTSTAHRKQFSFTLVYELINYMRLSAPYDTRCVNSLPEYCRTRSDAAICSRSLCDQWLAFTDVEKVAQTSRGINIAVRGESAPTQLIKFSPAITGNTFFIEACSILGLWCSLSVSSLFLTSIKFYREKTQNLPHLINKQYNLLLRVSRELGVDFNSIKATVNRREATERTNQPLAARISSLIIKLIILFLFAREMTFLSLDYFKYSTRSEMHLDKETSLKMPGISYCFDINEWYNISNPGYKFKQFNQSMTFLSNSLNFTVRQILESAVDASSAIKSCRIRRSLMSPLERKKNCTNYFNTTKLYQNEMICYQFTPRVDYLLKVDNFRNNDSHPNLLYSFVLNEAIARLYHLQVIVSHDIPTFSRFLANRLFRESNKELIISSFVEYQQFQLPSPYDTACDPNYKNDDCKITCLNFSRINLAPYSEVHTVPLDYRLVNYNDMKNQSLARLIKNAEVKCTNVCHSPCQDYKTKTIHHNGYSSDETLELALGAPAYPFYQLTTIPLYTPYTFVYQLACCASFWIGFSILAIINFSYKKQPIDQVQYLCSHLIKLTDQLERVASSRFRSRINTATCYKHTRSSKLKRFLLPSALAFGFICHSFTTVANYFRYQTVMDTRLTLEHDFTNLTATLCISFDQLNLKNNYSMKNIFMSSPRSEDVILECGHRGFNLTEFTFLPTILQQRVLAEVNSVSLCSSLFEVKKFVSLAMVCYQITPRQDIDQTEFDGKYHLNYVKAYQFFTLRREMSKYNLSLAVSKNSATVSLLLATLIDSCEGSKNIWSWINYIKYDIDSLPYPYDTGVFDAITDIRCRRKCVSTNSLIKNRFISSYSIADDLSLIHESPEQGASPDFVAIRSECDQICKEHKWTGAMKVSYFKTFHDFTYEDLYDKLENGTNGLWFRTSDFLVPHTHLYPALRLLDLILCIGTAYSIWFGLSALQTIDYVFCSTPLHSAKSTVSHQIISKKLYALRLSSHRVYQRSGPSTCHLSR